MGGSTSTTGYRDTEKTGTSTITPTGIKPYQTQFTQGYGDIYNKYQNIVGQPINLKSAPLYSTGFDPVVQNAISKGIQGIKAQQSTQAKQSANVLNQAGTGSNTSLLNVLNRQAAIASGAAGNQLYGVGLEQQRAQDVARQQMIAQQNADILAKRQAEIAGLTPGLGLLQALIQMGQLSRGEQRKETAKESTRYGENTSRSIF